MKILNCPFCGAKALFGEIGVDWVDDTTAAVHCRKCAAYGPYAIDPENAVRKWNNWWYAEGREE